MRCEATTLSIDSKDAQDKQEAKDLIVPLGPTNVALEAPTIRSDGDEAEAPTSALYYHEEQGLAAHVFEGDTVQFRWNRAGKLELNRVVRFDLQLPAAPQALMYLCVPRGLRVRANGGAVQSLSGLPESATPPPSLIEATNKQVMRWWQIDFGGNTRLDLQIEPQSDTKNTMITVVRNASASYELDAIGIRWTVKYLLDHASDRPVPAFGIPAQHALRKSPWTMKQ